MNLREIEPGQEAFFRRLLLSKCLLDTDGCWEWQGRTSSKGYGRIKFRGKETKASRVSWMAFRGPIPPRRFACHECDNRRCVRPKHLFLGTCKDNQEDMAAKGRSSLGTLNGRAKLTADQVRHLRSQHADLGMTAYALARQVGLSRGTVHNILIRKTWRHV